MKYMVIAKVNSKDYMVSVEANSACGAEHEILVLGYCGRYGYGVEGAQAFDAKTMKTDVFAGLVQVAETVSMRELCEIVAERNEVLMAKDAAEDRIREIKHQMEELAKELEAAKKILAA